MKVLKSLSVKTKKAIMTCMTLSLAVVGLSVNSFAAEDTSSVVAGVQSTFSSLSSTMSFANIISMIGIALLASAGIAT